MNPGLLKRAIITTRGFNMYDAVQARASELNTPFPSAGVQAAQRTLANKLMAAASGNLAAYHDINIIASDVAFSGGVIPTNLGFDGISWVNPTLYGLQRPFANTKTSNKGYSSSGSGPLTSLFMHRFVPDLRDLFLYVYVWNVSQSSNGIGVFNGTESQAIMVYPKASLSSWAGKAMGNINSSYNSAAASPAIIDGTNNGYCVYNRPKPGSSTNVFTGMEVNGVAYGEVDQAQTLGLSARNMSLLGATAAAPSAWIQAVQIIGYKSMVDTIALHTAVSSYLTEINS